MLNILARRRGLFAGGEVRHVFIVRHGATSMNNDDASIDRIRGWKDVPLSPAGREEAQGMAEVMAAHVKPDAIIASDLTRAYETAEILSDVTGSPITEVTMALRPWNVGALAGTLSSQAVPLLCHYAEYMPDVAVHGGESFNDFRARFFNGLHRALERNAGLIAMVAHHRNDRLLHAWRTKGYAGDGEVDSTEFNRHGQHTGRYDSIDIPMGALQSAAQVWDAGDPDYGKVDKQSVGYSESTGADRCGVCAYFMPPSCMKVLGRISAGDWCQLFKRAAGQ